MKVFQNNTVSQTSRCSEKATNKPIKLLLLLQSNRMIIAISITVYLDSIIIIKHLISTKNQQQFFSLILDSKLIIIQEIIKNLKLEDIFKYLNHNTLSSSFWSSFKHQLVINSALQCQTILTMKLYQQVINQMFNLQEVELNLKVLIGQFKTIQKKSKQSLQSYNHNQKSILIRIPKLILLAKMAKYLTLKQIISISSTCSKMRSIIFGPLGFKILNFQFNHHPIQIKQIQTYDQISNQFHHYNSNQYQDEKYLQKQRQKYKELLMKKYQAYIKIKQKYQGHCDRLKVAKTHLIKIKQQSLYLSHQTNKLEKTTLEYREKLKKLSDGFTDKIKRLDQQNDQLSKERTKLQNQKEALAGKVRQYQFEIQKTKQQSQKAKQILKKLKSYLLFKQL